MNRSNNHNLYGPLTKSIDIDETLMLLELTREFNSVPGWQDEALFRLPQASRKRRQEIVSTVRRKFLEQEDGQFKITSLLTLLTSPLLEARLKRDLLLAQYLRTTPLVWEAIPAVVLPHAEAGARPMARLEDAELPQSELNAFLERKLKRYTNSTFSRTRQHITAHLTKFGLLEAQPLPGDRIAKQFFAHFYQPDPRAFWFSLALEFSDQGWTSRSLDYIINQSWTRIAYCASPAYARFIMEEAERAALVVTNFFGSEKQVTLRGPDAVTNVAEAIRHG
jgi:hypothetical protein